MLCDDCDNFLEIAEAIRSLGLTIVKGITDNQGDKTWMRFVVEVSLSFVSWYWTIFAQVRALLYEFQKLKWKPTCWNTAGSESEQQELAQDGCTVFTCPDSAIKIYNLIMSIPSLVDCFVMFQLKACLTWLRVFLVFVFGIVENFQLLYSGLSLHLL